MVTLSEIPESGSVMTQGWLLPAHSRLGDVEFELRSRCPMSWRSPNTCKPSALISQS